MNAATTNLVVSLGAMQGWFRGLVSNTETVFTLVSVARKIDFEDPQILTYVRIAYVAVQVIVLGTYYYTSMKVRHHSFANRQML